MIENQWVKSFTGAVTVCDPEGVILEMNDRAAQIYRNVGGRKLMGSNIFNCHPENVRGKLKEIMEKRIVHVYTMEKNGAKKLLYQSPWYVDGEYRGFMEIILNVPFDMPHHVRDAKK